MSDPARPAPYTLSPLASAGLVLVVSLVLMAIAAGDPPELRGTSAALWLAGSAIAIAAGLRLGRLGRLAPVDRQIAAHRVRREARLLLAAAPVIGLTYLTRDALPGGFLLAPFAGLLFGLVPWRYFSHPDWAELPPLRHAHGRLATARWFMFACLISVGLTLSVRPGEGLATGECYRLWTAGERPAYERVACGEPHDAEAVAILAHPAPRGEPYPGATTLQLDAEAACVAAFGRYTGRDYAADAAHEITIAPPDPAAWVAGRRGIACLARPTGGGTSRGSLRSGGG